MTTSPLSGRTRLLAVIGHLSGLAGLPLLVPFVVLLVQRRKSPFLFGHARLALLIQGGATVLAVAGFVGIKAYVAQVPVRDGDFGLGRLVELLAGLMLCFGPLLLLYVAAAVVCAVQAARGKWFAPALQQPV